MIYKKTYKVTSWKNWNHCINDSSIEFFRKFSIYPNILMANSDTFHKIDMMVNQKKDNILNDDGEIPAPDKYVSIGSFISDNYALEMCIDDKVAIDYFILIFDSDPDDGGEPIPEEDSDIDIGDTRKEKSA